MSFTGVQDYVQNAVNNRNAAVLNSLLEGEPGMKELPDTSNAKEGDVLVLDSQKKPTWGTGGGGGGVLEVGMTGDPNTGIITLDKTAGEMWAAYPNIAVVGGDDNHFGKFPVIDADMNEGAYSFTITISRHDFEFSASSADEYPFEDDGGPK